MNRVFDTPDLYSGFETLAGVFAYSLQLYYDFSGYTDIARGGGHLFGVKLPINFDRPYLSLDIAEFWRRWHISFSNWLRDYLYYALPGNRTRVMPYVNLIITMLLGGLWHGVTWNFAIWGLLHGCAAGRRSRMADVAGTLAAAVPWQKQLPAVPSRTSLSALPGSSSARDARPGAEHSPPHRIADLLRLQSFARNRRRAVDRSGRLPGDQKNVYDGHRFLQRPPGPGACGSVGADRHRHRVHGRQRIGALCLFEVLTADSRTCGARLSACNSIRRHFHFPMPGVRMNSFPLGTAFGILVPLVSAAHFVIPAAKQPTPELFTSLVEFTPETTPPAPLMRHVITPEESPVPVQKPGHPCFEDSSGALNAFYAALLRTERRQQPDVTSYRPLRRFSDHRRSHHRRRPHAAAAALRECRPGVHADRQALGLVPTSWRADLRRRLADRRRQPLHLARRTLRSRRSEFLRRRRAHDLIKYSGDQPPPPSSRSGTWPSPTAAGLTSSLTASPSARLTPPTAPTTVTPGFATLHAAEPVHELEIHVESGRVRLFGVAAGKPGPGVVYDSLGMNGASITVLTRMFNREFWTAELRHRSRNLIIINYGTNEADFAPYVNGPYEKDLREAVRRVQAAVPEASLMLMSPMDRGHRVGLDQIETMATIPKIVAIQRRVAAETGCAFFDTFQAMGGEGTMARWY